MLCVYFIFACRHGFLLPSAAVYDFSLTKGDIRHIISNLHVTDNNIRKNIIERVQALDSIRTEKKSEIRWVRV